MAKVTQRDNTRNQSTVDISHSHIFMGSNGFEESVFLNNTGAELTLKPGSLVLRNGAAPLQIIPAVADATIANVIGVIAIENEVVLADAATLNVNYCTKGKVDETLLSLPGAYTLDTVQANRTVKDHLNALGFELVATVENTKLDN